MIQEGSSINEKCQRVNVRSGEQLGEGEVVSS